MVHPARLTFRRAAGLALLITGLVLAACQSGTPPEQEITPVGGSGGTASTVSGRTAAAGTTSVITDITSGATGGANVSVSPSEVTLGSIVISLTVEPAQPVFDPARVSSNATSSDGQQGNAAQPKGYVVLGGAALKITNNFDATQSPPADQPTQMLRHVGLQVKDKASGQLIPNLVVSIDLLRDGRPVLQDQALAPMVQAGGSVSQMQYGNNVKLPGRGEYQVFVHLEASPLLGSGSNGVAQFNVSVK